MSTGVSEPSLRIFNFVLHVAKMRTASSQRIVDAARPDEQMKIARRSWGGQG
jgi:hypothetical protein